MKRTILAVGDIIAVKDQKRLSFLDRSFLDFLEYKDLFTKNSVDFKVCDYQALSRGDLPEIDTPLVKVMLFFPYGYWNRHIEKRSQNGRIYGGRTYGEKFKKFFDQVEAKLQTAYKDHSLSFVNSPNSVKIDRDKYKSKLLLKKKKIPTPVLHRIKSTKSLLDLVNRGEVLYLKPRFGAMGKGITYVAKDGWYTNFLYRRSKIISRGYDYGWEFTEVTGEIELLDKLIKEGFIVEEAVELPTLKGKKFDLRCYCVYGKVPYLYARSVPVEKLITNWSQGGKIEKRKFLAKIPTKTLSLAKSYALKAAEAFGLNYAGIDLVFSQNYRKLYVLEAHSFPSYETGFDLMRYLVNRI